jgi:tetratricopeptide (TPR) repeat protein
LKTHEKLIDNTFFKFSLIHPRIGPSTKLKICPSTTNSESPFTIFKLWILVLLSIIFLISCGEDKKEEEGPDYAKIEEARKAFDEENLDKAKSTIEYFLAQFPDNIEALYLYAQVLVSRGELLKAREKANEILAIDPTAAEPKAILGEIHFGRKEFSEAMDLSRQALKKNPQLQVPYRVIGEIYLRKGKVKESIKVLLEAYRLKADVDTLKKLSAAYIKDKNYKEAKKYLDEALKLDDLVPGLHYNSAVVYANLDNGPKAMEHVELALKYYIKLDTFFWVGKSRDLRRMIVKKFNIKE